MPATMPRFDLAGAGDHRVYFERNVGGSGEAKRNRGETTTIGAHAQSEPRSESLCSANGAGASSGRMVRAPRD